MKGKQRIHTGRATRLGAWQGAKRMNVLVREYTEEDIGAMIAVWNEVVLEGNAFPQEEPLTEESGLAYFASQSYCAVAQAEDGAILGLYTLHPNNIGRCGHIGNASYAVASQARGLHIGDQLVRDCVAQTKKHGFRILQFNAVVASNIHARHLYERLGFTQLGTIPGGFRMKDGHYEDICPYYLQVDA
jgi:L-amino acid N-acyltransferase YncA